jgi:class 3 adenylate cyclase/alpha-beta hydrolase superfamily lysophospholipase
MIVLCGDILVGESDCPVIMERPQTSYVEVGGAEVAYQIVGQGPPDVVYVPGFSHIDLRWDNPVWAGFLERLATFGRLILFDRRGTGASDAVLDTAMPTWEEWAEDVRAVLDAARSERAVVFAENDGGPTGLLFTAMQPERVSSLILANTTARRLRSDDYPIGVAPEALDQWVELWKAAWGTAEIAPLAWPSRASDPEFRLWVAKETRAIATPKNAAAQIRYIVKNLDARDALPLIQVPTLVLSTMDNLVYTIEEGRYLADHINGAKFVELPGGDIYVLSSTMAIEEIGEFLTGERPLVEVDRVLTTLLFTDIVGSTQLAARAGDRRWSELLSTHREVVRSELHHFRGHEIDTAGDGFLATFDGPARAIRCACAIRDRLGALGLQMRAGLHTGEVELTDDGPRGLAIHIGARVCAISGPGEVLVSGTVKDLVAGSRIEFVDRGEHELKGVPGTWKLYAVAS